MTRSPARRTRTPILGLTLILTLAGALPLAASSHREAPGILASPQVDGTDFYMFRSYEEGRDGFVTLIADYNPLQDAYGGPNYFPLDPNAAYDIHVTNNGDVEEDITFRFRFFQGSPFFSLPIGDQDVAVPLSNIAPFGIGFGNMLNQNRIYTVELIRGGVDNPTSRQLAVNRGTGGVFFGVPFDNVGEKSVPFNYEAYASLFITDIGIPGCADGRVFAGQRKEPFAVNLGEIFDLINLNPVGDPNAKRSSTEDKNITSLILEVPTDCLTAGGPGIIGGWTTARLPRNRTLSDNPTYDSPDQQSGDLVQVSRLANPLINELAIGLPDKNLFNAAHPRDDGANFLTYVTNPTLPTIIQSLFGVQAPTNFPRNDLVWIFLTGIPGVNEDGSVGEIMRLNTAIAPTPKAMQSNLGVAGGDNAGYPNGRRPGDDTVDISLRAFMGVLCHLGLGVCNPADAPDGLLPYTDQTYQNADQFGDAFPYLGSPVPGSPNQYRTFNANLQGSQEVPPVNSPWSGACCAVLNDAKTELVVACTHNVPDVIAAHIHQAPAGSNGGIVCGFGGGASPIQFVCDAGNVTIPFADFVAALEQGNTYVNIHSATNPPGEIRGQLR